MNTVDQLAKILRDYHQLGQTVKKSDIIFVLGSHDPHVARYAAQLYKKGLAPYIVVSGGVVHPAGVLENDAAILEAVGLANIMMKEGIPAEAIIIEDKAQNTGENCSYTKKLLEERAITHKTAILVQMPYMERRTYATVRAQRPSLEITVTSQPISYENYCKKIDKVIFLNDMVGDLQRIRLYPEKGFQIAQEIPDNVWEAFEQLVQMGYDRRLVKD